MAVAVALWSVSVAPGKRVTIVPQADLRIVNVALGHKLEDASGRTSLTVTYKMPSAGEEHEDDEETEDVHESTTVLCSLTPGKIEQAVVDLILEEDESFHFEAVGKNTIFLTGNYIDQHPEDNFPFDEESEDEEEDAYDLREVSSDVEVDPRELGSDDDSRFEEVVDEPKSLKRDSGAMEVDDEAKNTGRVDKRIKGADGKAVPAGEETTKDDEDKKEKKKKKKKEKKAKEPQESDKPQLEKKDTATPKATTKDIAGSIKIKDSKVGSGPQVKKGNTVSMRYIGKLDNGKIFDSNTKGKPFTFHLGKGEVIKGWDEGIVGMQVGGERVLTIPPNMAYGKKKMADIPPNSTLTFECKLLEIK